MTTPPLQQPLRALHQALRDGSVSAVELADSASQAYRTRGQHDHAYMTWNGDAALAFAKATDALLQQGGDAGALMGLPVSIKDIYAVPGLPTYAGSSRRLPAEWETPGPVVSALLNQLPVVMGKTHTVEFAFGGLGTNAHHGAPRNPWDTLAHRTPGGSSSGAGVSLASGTAGLAFGTDTAGSVRVPASMTGVAGLKTTVGRWSTAQIVPLSTTLDTPGLLARRVDDLAFAFDALDPGLSPAPGAVPTTPDLADLTFGVPEQFFWDDCSPGIAEAVQDAIKQLEAAGARIVTLELPKMDDAFTLFQQGGLAAAELAAFLHTTLPDAIEELDPNVAARIAAADGMPGWEYVRRRQVIDELTRAASERLTQVDAVLTPTVAITPPTLESLAPEGAYPKANMKALRNTVIANFMGLCALTLPVGRDAANMPVGLQVMAGPWQDARLLAIGQAIEAKLGNGLDVLGEVPTVG
ncbi:aspartyl-tRNA(Asn)/glutamyl-tRNA(Gln) amidotransferase subunit A [Franzmannia pantelleriensis]|uniref:Aspartyl-tRNA(Asn)/glutamyl-tRNA(Gln) amidotransferase subunit A n=1 Tax=Franzmannia pantelleriensis TaxID=48727 RepID=A0A1G9EFZ5_9GAMM|nr:amidase [Halomonas pantelleriensis]SDK74955.1 aspartyl-tRNA(Asn)/glutamyl-tRNA(Gln) amidotransferase subunit A [Halomonas pantelleriensis]